MSKCTLFISLLWISFDLTCSRTVRQARTNMVIPEDGMLDFGGFVKKYNGRNVETHEVLTKDGFILDLFHIPGNKTQLPLLLLHGLGDSADSFVRRGNTSLGISLVNADYDVWVGNSRGNPYGKRHKYLKETDSEFWNFSFHESGIYDVAATVDYILRVTGHPKLNLISYSLGSTMAFALGATKPEYNKKINFHIATAPAASMLNLHPLPKFLFRMGPVIHSLLENLGIQDIVGAGSPFGSMTKSLCLQKGIGYSICAYGIIFPLAGFDVEELDPDFYYVFMSGFPSAVGRKSAYHALQLVHGFNHFDYGPKNIEVYNSTVAPAYDLSKVSTRTAIMACANDRLATVKDTVRLSRMLPNGEYHQLERQSCNHIFVLGRTAHLYMHPRIFKLLDMYGGA